MFLKMILLVIMFLDILFTKIYKRNFTNNKVMKKQRCIMSLLWIGANHKNSLRMRKMVLEEKILI